MDPAKGKLFCRNVRQGDDGHCWLCDAWVFEHDCPLGALTLQEAEVCDAMWAGAEKIRAMMETGEFLGPYFYPYFDALVEAYK